MNSKSKAIAAILVLLFGIVPSHGEKEVLSKSSWLQDPSDKSKSSIAYTWKYLLRAHRNAIILNNEQELIGAAKQARTDNRSELARQVSDICGDLEEVVLDAYERTIPLLQSHPDKVLTEELLVHLIRYSGGANERWEPIAETLLLLNEDWTVEALMKLTIEERNKVKHLSRHEDKKVKILKLVEKANAS